MFIYRKNFLWLPNDYLYIALFMVAFKVRYESEDGLV